MHLPKQSESKLFIGRDQYYRSYSCTKSKGGEIDIAYKQLGNNSDKPIVLVNGLATTMDMWGPTLLKELSSKYKVIIFDNRGIGNHL